MIQTYRDKSSPLPSDPGSSAPLLANLRALGYQDCPIELLDQVLIAEVAVQYELLQLLRSPHELH